MTNALVTFEALELQALRVSRWEEFVRSVGFHGKECFEKSGVTATELGALVRAMNSSSMFTDVTVAIRDLRTTLLERFHKDEVIPSESPLWKGNYTGPALADVFHRQELALFAAVSYLLTIQSKETMEWCEAAVDLHMQRNTMFDFMLAARFGIKAEASDAPYGTARHHFNEWLRLYKSGSTEESL